ncbi:MAG: hypothetical protein AAF280_04905 [Pseudomonadota bacterium]
MLKPTLITLLLLALATPIGAASVTLGPGAVIAGGEYTTGGGLTVAVEPRPINGKLGLCGIWAQSDPMPVYTRRAASTVLAKGVVQIDGQTVTRNLNFLNRVRPAESYAGAPTGCMVVNRAWTGDPTARMTVRIPRQKIIATSASRLENGPRVFFTRSDLVNPALAKGSLVPSYITSRSSSGTQY